MKELHFYFDFLSPYSYFAWTWVRDLCEEHALTFVPEPVVLGVILAHHGQLGPAEIPAKRAFTFRDCLRVAGEMGLDLEMPRYHPFNPLAALRLALPQVSGEDQLGVIDTIWELGWREGGDPSDAGELARALDAAGYRGDAIVAKTRDPDVKAALKERTTRAIEAGVFGVPTFIVGDELFWGNDQRGPLQAWITEGRRGYDPAQLERFVDTPSAVGRR